MVGWRPGSPRLGSIHDDYGNVYEYDPRQDAYVYRRRRAYQPPRQYHPTIWGSLAWSVWWAWYPSIFIGWGLTALFVGSDGANAADTSIPGIVLAVIALAALVIGCAG